MNERIDTNLRKWLKGLAADWDLPIEQVALRIGEEEINNRVQSYPKVRSVLFSSPFDIRQFASASKNCWVMAGQYDAIRFNEFLGKGRETTTAIQSLIRNFPSDDASASKRIQDFLESAVLLGFSTPEDSFDWAGAAQLASLILTTLYPQRFVDYRRERWRRFAETFGYEQPSLRTPHGEWVVWAGKLAQDICETETYQELWPQNDPRLAQPLWVISGICWTGLSPRKPLPDPIDPDTLSFPEGAEKRRLHFMRERNRALVSKAKAIGLERDPMLRCQACGFSFIEKYGERGQGFIEAHHKQPVAELKAGSRTTVDDIVLVCANCHRMLHAGDTTLSIEELKRLLQILL